MAALAAAPPDFGLGGGPVARTRVQMKPLGRRRSVTSLGAVALDPALMAAVELLLALRKPWVEAQVLAV